jgi:hypothetical protein
MTEFQNFTRYRSIRDFFNHTHISFRHKYVYFGVAKAANSTIKHYLHGVEYQGTPYKIGNVHNKLQSPLLSPYQLDAQELQLALYSDKYVRFTMVRNPFHRLLSCFLDRIQDPKSGSYRVAQAAASKDPRELSFSEFVDVIARQKPREMDCHWRPQVFEVYLGEIRMTRTLKFEELPMNLVELRDLTSCEDPKIFDQDINRSPSITSADKKARGYYTPAIVRKVRRIYKEDFNSFGYSQSLDSD